MAENEDVHAACLPETKRVRIELSRKELVALIWGLAPRNTWLGERAGFMALLEFDSPEIADAWANSLTERLITIHDRELG